MRLGGAVAVLGFGLGTLAACLITQPPGDPPPIDLKQPRILSDRVTPPLASPITAIQALTKLIVPVECDPEATLQYRLFADFDPSTAVALPVSGSIDPDKTLNPTRSVEIGLFGAGFDPAQCHTLTLIVAACLGGGSCSAFSNGSSWTPLPPGGDQETWFYRPNGNEGACPGYDAGSFADAAAFETGAE